MADRCLQVFHAVKHLSFTGAAEALCMTQRAVDTFLAFARERLVPAGRRRLASA